AQLDFSRGIVDSPIVDTARGKVYVFASSDGSTSCPLASPCAAVYQLSTTFNANDAGTKVTVGTAGLGTPNPLFSGGFDNAYYTSANGTGNLYVCGNTGAVPTLYQIPIQAGAFVNATGTAVVTMGAALSNGGCSPVSDIFNPNDGIG